MKETKKIYSLYNDKILNKFIIEWFLSLGRRSPSRICTDLSYSLKDLLPINEFKRITLMYEIYNFGSYEEIDQDTLVNLKFEEDAWTQTWMVQSMWALLVKENFDQGNELFENFTKEYFVMGEILKVCGTNSTNWTDPGMLFKKIYYPEINKKENLSHVHEKLRVIQSVLKHNAINFNSDVYVDGLLRHWISFLVNNLSEINKLNFLKECQ